MFGRFGSPPATGTARSNVTRPATACRAPRPGTGAGPARSRGATHCQGAQPFADAADLTRRAHLSRNEINALARADALAPLAGHRRSALWTTLVLDADAPRSAHIAVGAAAGEPKVDLRAPTASRDIVADYAHTARILRRHPLALLRGRFTALPLPTAAQVNSARHRQPVRATGIITCHRGPSTASGVKFVTQEDETGTINVVGWRATAEKYRRQLLSVTLLTVYGHVECVETSAAPVASDRRAARGSLCLARRVHRARPRFPLKPGNSPP